MFERRASNREHRDYLAAYKRKYHAIAFLEHTTQGKEKLPGAWFPLTIGYVIIKIPRLSWFLAAVGANQVSSNQGQAAQDMTSIRNLKGLCQGSAFDAE